MGGIEDDQAVVVEIGCGGGTVIALIPNRIVQNALLSQGETMSFI